jgi:hypothetical protein
MTSDAYLLPSKAKILKIEISNPGLPANLTDLITSRELNSYKRNRLFRRQVFKDEHDYEVRKQLHIPNDAKSTFGEYIQKYYDLKRKYVRNVLNYGNYIRAKDVSSFLHEVETLNELYRGLCGQVRKILTPLADWKDVLLFNPRVRFAMFIISEQQVSDEHFRYELSAMRIPFDGNPTVEELLGITT